jgi:hypothetical protein
VQTCSAPAFTSGLFARRGVGRGRQPLRPHLPTCGRLSRRTCLMTTIQGGTLDVHAFDHGARRSRSPGRRAHLYGASLRMAGTIQDGHQQAQILQVSMVKVGGELNSVASWRRGGQVLEGVHERCLWETLSAAARRGLVWPGCGLYRQCRGQHAAFSAQLSSMGLVTGVGNLPGITVNNAAFRQEKDYQRR